MCPDISAPKTAWSGEEHLIFHLKLSLSDKDSVCPTGPTRSQADMYLSLQFRPEAGAQLYSH